MGQSADGAFRFVCPKTDKFRTLGQTNLLLRAVHCFPISLPSVDQNNPKRKHELPQKPTTTFRGLSVPLQNYLIVGKLFQCH